MRRDRYTAQAPSGYTSAVMSTADSSAFDRELAALRAGAGLLDRAAVARLALTGKDRQRFLNGLVTCDVKALEPGQGCYGFFTSGQGKILAEVLVLALDDRLWLELPPGMGGMISDHLKKYLVADRVEILPLDEMRPLSLVGPGVAAALPELEALPPAPFSHRELAVAGIAFRTVRGPVAGLAGVTLWVGAAEAERLLVELSTRPGVVEVGAAALEQVRVEAGAPAFGRDFGPEHFPQETGWEALAVSYSKGCYLGQEIVARLHYRGKPNHGVRRLIFAAGPLPPTGAALSFEGQPVGKVGSAVPTGTRGGVGIAVVHRKAYDPGTVLEVEGGGRAEVALLSELVFPESSAPAR